MKITSLITFSIAVLLNSLIFAQENIEDNGFKNLNVSPTGNHIIFSHQESPGFYIFDLINNKTQLIEDNKFSSYQASFSADGKYVTYKKFVINENSRLQQPMLYDIETGKLTKLYAPVQRCGTPSFSSTGKIVFTIGKSLHILNANGEEEKTLNLSAYANLTPLSPNAKFIVYNDTKDRLWLLNIVTEEKKLLTKPGKGYFEPLWSPDAKKIAASSMSGDLVVFDITNNSLLDIGKGMHAVWTNDSKYLIYSKADILENREVVSQDLYSYDIATQIEKRLTNSGDRKDYPAVLGNSIYYSLLNSGKLIKTDLSFKNNTIEFLNPIELNIRLDSKTSTPEIKFNKKKDPLSAVYFDIPYVNQRYDTPDWFNGNSACGATAAIQCISYFGLVRQWPVWASSPYPHISDYGNYVCEVYTYNGHTYNIGGRDPNGTIGYGGFGFIIQNNWANTREYMRLYAQQHGLGSAVDWSPTRNELAIEVTNEDPFVLLNDLTTSGHYISVIGYDNIDTTTVIVNDPYGDKNLGYANYYGRRAWYDWPGYNNGYENLNTVWCFIYFRGDPPADICVDNFTVNADTGALGQRLYVTTDISNIGNLASQSTSVEFYISENGVYDENAFVMASYALPALQVGQSHSIQDSISLPDSLISNSFKLCVFADADTINSEMLKDNNVMSRDFVVYGYPRLYSIRPVENSVVNTPRPQIRVKYQDYITAINKDSVKLYLDNVDITDSSTVQLRRIDYFPGYDLSEGLHICRVEVPSTIGLTTIYNWSFEIQLVSALNENDFIKPEEYFLYQNYPNPFNPETKIAFNLPTAGRITLKIFDIRGNLVKEVIKNNFYNAGYHSLSFAGNDLASGVYFYTLLNGNNSLTRKMLLLR